jgi:hypothetical protein
MKRTDTIEISDSNGDNCWMGTIKYSPTEGIEIMLPNIENRHLSTSAYIFALSLEKARSIGLEILKLCDAVEKELK